MAPHTEHNLSEEKQRALSLAITQIDKQFGKGSIMRLGETQTLDIAVIPSGSLALDAALGVGGVPRGRVIEIYGPEASGKTTLALHIVASAQRSGGEAAFVDAEHALDPTYARRLGVNTDDLLIAQPDSGDTEAEDAVATRTLRQPCPCCGGRMVVIETFERGQAPRARAPPPTRAA